MQKSVSIIIPLYVISNRFFEDFKKYDNLRYKNYDVTVVCDKKITLPPLHNAPTKLILTRQKKTGPAEKRDIALRYAKGEICAFIDDDAYPHPDWLKNALTNFRDRNIVAVGGPGVTPPDDPFWSKIGGHIVESYLCSGEVQYRFFQGHKRKFFVNDYPAYNLFVKTSALKKVGGYGSTFYGGEDTFLCMKLTRIGKILYDSTVLAYHHRRSFPVAHLKQIANVGQHRGYFFKKYPETSRIIFYLLPSLLTSGLLIMVLLSLYNPFLFLLPFILGFFSFLFLASYSVKRHKIDYITSVIAGLGIILTHITYGVYFIKGLFTKQMSR